MCIGNDTRWTVNRPPNRHTAFPNSRREDSITSADGRQRPATQRLAEQNQGGNRTFEQTGITIAFVSVSVLP